MASNHAMVLASASGVARWKSHNAPDFMEKTPHPLKVRLLATRFNGVASKVVYVIPAVCALRLTHRLTTEEESPWYLEPTKDHGMKR